MFKNNFGKLLVYAPTSHRKRLQFVRTATEETAKLLNLDYEVVRFGNDFSPIYVYYECDDGGEPIPLYCDDTRKAGTLQEIGAALRNMMFVLSFHPKYSALRQVRSAIMSLS